MNLKTNFVLATLFLSSPWHVLAAFESLSPSQISEITQNLATAATHSWELGTRAEALLELYVPEFSVFSSNPLPPPSRIPSELASAISPVLSIAKSIVSNRSTSNGNITGPQPLIQDGSAGDPASLGVAVLLANWTGQNVYDNLDYGGAAKDQLDYLLNYVPRTDDGAISHRVDIVQLWSDFVYMVPPFLAYYGALENNLTLLSEAYNQVSLYRKYLIDTEASNLWKHILLGADQGDEDEGHWSTGNAWAAGGMLRVLATFQGSQYKNMLQSEQNDLANWIHEIHAGMYPHLGSKYLFHNYADQPNTFDDAASTTLLASTVYRLSVLWGDYSHVPWAEITRNALVSKNLDSSGWLTPVVNPEDFSQQGSESPESQAFVLEMQAAWTAWVANGSIGADANFRPSNAIVVRAAFWKISFTSLLILFVSIML